MKTDVLLCDRCMRIAQFRFARAGAPPTLRCWRHAVFYGPVFRRALQVAAVVGTILFAINQLNVVLSTWCRSWSRRTPHWRSTGYARPRWRENWPRQQHPERPPSARSDGTGPHAGDGRVASGDRASERRIRTALGYLSSHQGALG